MKFILIYDFLTELGGLEKLMATHAKFLKSKGFDVLLIFGEVDKELLKEDYFKDLKVINSGSWGKGTIRIISNLLGANKLKKIIKKEDVLISYSYPTNFLVRKFKNKKIQYLNHYPNFLYLPWKERVIWANNLLRKTAILSSLVLGSSLKRMDKTLIKKNELVFANSKNTKKKIDKIYYINSTISYPPVQAEIHPINKSNIKRKYGLNGYIYAPGRIIPDKRFDWLIEAFSKVKDKNINLVITGQGKGDYIKKLKNLTKNLKVEDRVKFLGIVSKEELVKLYSEAKICAFIAPGEDFGLVPVESISCGTPVVSWKDNSGPQETITENISGLLAKPYYLEEFAKKMYTAINMKWNKNKILKSSKKFSEKKIRSEFIGAINKVISK